jgi:hypothetical protein
MNIDETDGDDDGYTTSLKIHPVTGNIMVLGGIWDTYSYGVLYTIDQDTGRLLNVTEFKDSGADVDLNTLAYTNTGDYVIGGSKNGEFSAEFPVVPQTGSGTGTIVILRSAVPVSNISTNWQIGGTGIDPFQSIEYIERYQNLTGTTRQGSGAIFDIIDNGNGSYSAAVVNGGTNYLAGHKIKILGTSLGGATPDNDITITVQTVDGSGVIQGGGVGNTGTAAGTETATYTALSGANFETGSGLVFTFEGPRDTNNYSNAWSSDITTNGSNYVNGDVVTVLGTSLGGTSPANDLTINLYKDEVSFRSG